MSVQRRLILFVGLALVAIVVASVASNGSEAAGNNIVEPSLDVAEGEAAPHDAVPAEAKDVDAARSDVDPGDGLLVRIVDAASGEPVRGAQVWFLCADDLRRRGPSDGVGDGSDVFESHGESFYADGRGEVLDDSVLRSRPVVVPSTVRDRSASRPRSPCCSS